MTSTRSDLPLLALPHGGVSVPTFELLDAARGRCRLCFLVDTAEPLDKDVARFLVRYGPVVETAGRSPDEVATSLAPLGPDGIIAYRDRDLPLAAALADRLGLRFMTPEVAARLHDKALQRAALAAGGLPGPRVAELSAGAGADAQDRAAGAVGFPAVLKPCSGAGSSYVFRLEDRHDLAAALARTVAGGRRPGRLLLEEHLGDHPRLAELGYASVVSVESLVVDGAICHLATNGRLPFAEAFRETGVFIPSALLPAEVEAVLDTASKAIAAVGIEQGGVHTEIKLTPQGPRVVEVNGRVGGFVPAMLKVAGGIDLFALSMLAALGRLEPPEEMPRCDQVGYRLMHQPPAGTRSVTSLVGLDRLRSFVPSPRVTVRHRPGEPIDTDEGTSALVFEAVGAVRDHDELSRLVAFVEEVVSISYEGAAP